MNLCSCSYEKELGHALRDGHWPDGCSHELRAHVDQCPLCNETVLVTQTFQRARAESVQTAPPGSPELLWWRAQLRRRNTAAVRVSRPVTIAETFALIITFVFAVVFVCSQYDHGLRWASWWPEITPSKVVHLLSTAFATWNLLLFVPALAFVIVLSGAVLYLASERS